VAPFHSPFLAPLAHLLWRSRRPGFLRVSLFLLVPYVGPWQRPAWIMWMEYSLLEISHRFPSSFGCWASMQKSDMGMDDIEFPFPVWKVILLVHTYPCQTPARPSPLNGTSPSSRLMMLEWYWTMSVRVTWPRVGGTGAPPDGRILNQGSLKRFFPKLTL
jgi:hypothetical protein